MQGEANPLPPEALLQHAPFLRHLARELVGDEHAAADVVQDAWAAALESPPREARSLRGWLAIVVSNLARNARRGGRRRSERERAVARPERLEPSGGLALERLDVQRVLIELLMELPEEQRTVLYLRYYEEETPSAIAARLGVPVKTIKTRHTRALAALRARLDERSGGDRAAWVSAFVPWIGARGAPGVPVAAKLALGIVAAASAGVAWWALARPEPVELAAAFTAPGARSEGDERVRPAGEREPVAVADSSAARVPPALTGAVRWIEDDLPAAGVVVEARLPRSSAVVASAVADSEGRYRIEWPAGFEARSVSVRTSPASAAPTRSLSARESPPAAAGVDLWVTHGATLEATVVDAAGAPVPGALVCVRSGESFSSTAPCERTAVAGNDGCFRVEHVAEAFTLTAEAPGLACESGLRGTLAPGSVATGLEVVLAEAIEFHGRVVDRAGAPVSGAELAIDAHNSSSSRDGTSVAGVQRFVPVALRASSDDGGAFVLGPAPRRNLGVRTTHPRFLYRDEVLVPDEHERVELDPGHSLAGRVLAPGGTPVAGAEVTVRSATSWRDTMTDERGGFRLEALAPSDNAFVLVEAEGYAVFARQPIIVGPDGGVFLELELEPPAPLGGRVIDPEGRPLANAIVHVEGARTLVYDDVDFGEKTTVEWATEENQTRTDAEGRFLLPRLYTGRFDVRVSPADDPRLAHELQARSGRDDLELVLDRARLERVVFAGRVSGADPREPVRSFTVSVMEMEEDGSGSSKGSPAFGPAARGRFRMAGNEPGRYRISVQAAGYATWRSEEREYGVGVHDLEVVLTPACAIELVVREERFDLEGRRRLLNRGARIEIHDLEGRALWLEFGQGSSTRAMSVGQEPQVLSGLPRAPVRLIAKCPRYLPTTMELDLTHPPEGPVEVLMRLDPGSEVADLHLGVFFTEDPELAGALEPAAVRRALEEGRLWMPDVALELEFLDVSGEAVARGEIVPEGGGYVARCELLLELMSTEARVEEPGLGVSMPARARTLIVRAAGGREQRLALELERGERTLLGVALLRKRGR